MNLSMWYALQRRHEQKVRIARAILTFKIVGVACAMALCATVVACFV